MAKRRHQPPRRPGARASGGSGGSALRVRKLEGGRGWALVAPPCAAERADDLEEVRAMIEADELDIARDELLYLLGGCPELLEAHVLLGQLAVLGGDEGPANVELARGHFGFAFTLGEKALAAAKGAGPLLGAEAANAPWHEAARGLAWCLEKQGERRLADEVASLARRLDPSDPAEVAAMLDELRAGGLPIVELG